MKSKPLLQSVIAGFCLMITLLYVAVASVALRIDSYPQTPPFDAMAESLVELLKGSTQALPEPFTEREKLHMDDVRDLFMGGKQLAIVCGVVGLAQLATSLFTNGRINTGKGLRRGMLAFFVLFIALGLWAAIDFDGWFVTMHRLVFRNDLWLLDPKESLLIQMVPLSFFISAVKTIALRIGLCALSVFVGSVALSWKRRDGSSRKDSSV